MFVSVLCGMALLGSKGVSKHRDFTSIKIPCCRRQFDKTFKRYSSVHHEDGVTESRPSPVEVFEFQFYW